MFHVPNHYRIRSGGTYGSTDADSNNGAFIFDHAGLRFLCIASDGGGWEHVSVSQNRNKTPTWEQMCFVKALFWDPSDTVLQFHPKESDYVNIHPHALHLWRKAGVNSELPPTEFV